MPMIQKPASDNKSMPALGSGSIWRSVARLIRRHPIMAGIAGAVIVLVTAMGALLWNTLSIAEDTKQDISKVMGSLQEPAELQKATTTEGYAELVSRFVKVEEDVRTLRQRADLAQGMAWVPGVGSRIKESRQVLELAEHTVLGARLTLQGYGPVVYAMDASATQQDLSTLRKNLEAARPLFDEALVELNKAQELRSQVRDVTILGSTVETALNQMDKYLPLVSLAATIARDTPQIVSEGLALRETISALRTVLDDPATFLERPGELEIMFKNLQEQALAIQLDVLKIKDATKQDNSEVAKALDTALQVSVLLANLGDGLGRFAAAADFTLSVGPLTEEAGRRLGEELPRIKDVLQATQQQMDQLSPLLTPESNGDNAFLSALVSRTLGSGTVSMQREEGLLSTGVKTVDFLTSFLGYDSPKTYILIGQNNDEIRATGGFLGVVAELKIEQGKLVQLRFMDSDNVDAPPYTDNPPAPEPVYKYLWISKLLFRDANWNPHFPAAAAQLADIYQRSQGVKVDGVVAVTKEVMLDMVDALGGVRVPGEPDVLLNRSLAKQHIEGELPYSCTPQHASERSKRCFDQDLFQVVVGQLLGPLDTQNREAVVQVFLKRLQTKDLMVHLFDSQAAELLWEKGWNGAMTQVDHDYLMIVDSALPGHTRSVVQRRVQYQVSLDRKQGADAELLLEYTHKGHDPDPNCRQAVPLPTGCYWDYLRIYTPVTASDIQAPPMPLHEGSEWLIWGYEPADSLSVISSPRVGQSGFTEIGGYLGVEPGTSTTIPLQYKLPSAIIREVGGGVLEYRLLIQKQPGVPVEPVSVLVQLPPGATLVRASPTPTAQKGNWVQMDVDLAGDVTFVVDFRTP